MDIKVVFPVLTYRIGKKLTYLSTLCYRKNPIKWSIKKYKQRFGVKIDLDNPKTFYEKMNYWKHFSYTHDQDDLTDKIKVKSILERDGFGDWCTKCLFQTNDIKELKKWIEQNKATINKFVIKASHSCGDVFIYNNGLITRKGGRRIPKLSQLYRMLETSLKYNHYYSRFEQNYKNLTPMIYIEEFIDTFQNSIEYEIMLNYGEVKFTNVVFNRQSKSNKEILVDSNFKPFIKDDLGGNIRPPVLLEDILKIIKKECASFPFCRADFIQTDEKTYFCEFTFCKSGGLNIFKPQELNIKIGNLFKL